MSRRIASASASDVARRHDEAVDARACDDLLGTEAVARDHGRPCRQRLAGGEREALPGDRRDDQHVGAAEHRAVSRREYVGPAANRDAAASAPRPAVRSRFDAVHRQPPALVADRADPAAASNDVATLERMVAADVDEAHVRRSARAPLGIDGDERIGRRRSRRPSTRSGASPLAIDHVAQRATTGRAPGRRGQDRRREAAARRRRHAAVPGARAGARSSCRAGRAGGRRSTRKRRGHHHHRSCIVTTVGITRVEPRRATPAPRVCSAWAWTTSGRKLVDQRRQRRRRRGLTPVGVDVLLDAIGGADPAHADAVDVLVRATRRRRARRRSRPTARRRRGRRRPSRGGQPAAPAASPRS